jgi:hypothetical protein
MLENCLSGSEGGGAIALPTPITVSAVSRLTCKNSILSRVSAAPLATTPPVQCRIGFQPVSVSQRGSFDLPVKPTSKCPNSRARHEVPGQAQALRAWLPSACPSGTKAVRPSKGLALS